MRLHNEHHVTWHSQKGIIFQTHSMISLFKIYNAIYLIYRLIYFQVVFQNITPTEVELSSLQLPPEYVQLNTSQVRTHHVAAPKNNNSDDDFEDPPMQNKTKENRKNSMPLSQKEKVKEFSNCHFKEGADSDG